MSVAALNMLWESRRQDKSCVLAGSACLLVGLLSCMAIYPSFIASNMNVVESVVWWAGIITIATGTAFIARLYENNKTRNSMYLLLFHDSRIAVRNMPEGLLWHLVCSGRHIPFDAELAVSFLELWEESMDGTSEKGKLVFSPSNFFRIRRKADEFGISAVMDAICEGVPAADVLA